MNDLVHEKLLGDLGSLKLSKIREIYRETIDQAAEHGWSNLDVLNLLFSEESAFREQRAMLARLKRARLPQVKTVDQYDFFFPSRIPKQRILRLLDCDFIGKHDNIVFVGPSGVGKTHLMIALGYAAVEKKINIRFTRVIDMINELTIAQETGVLVRALRSYVKPQLLLLDELGYLPVDKTGADLLFQIVSSRYEQGSIVITTNRPFSEWGQMFNADNSVATAMIDRLMHHGDAVVIRGKSYRMKDKSIQVQ